MAVFLFAFGLVIFLNWEWRLTRGWRKWQNREEQAEVEGLPILDVVMCVRNGVQELPGWLDGMSAQEGVALRITVVDDDSTDGTAELLAGAQIAAPHSLCVVHVKDTRPGKKDALAAGLDRAEGPWVWLTDVDCRPVSTTTAVRMMSPLLAGAGDVVLGVSLPQLSSPSLERNGSWARAFAMADALRIARTYLGWAGEGMPFMAVGRNWAFRRELWPGIGSHVDVVASGDDDLVLQEMLSKGSGGAAALRVVGMMEPASQMATRAPVDWTAMARAKRRHLSTGNHYPTGVLFLLGLPAAAGLLWGLAAVLAAGQGVEVFHSGLWIAVGTLGAMWMLHALTFRSFVRACGIRTADQWLGLWQPGVWLWLMGQTFVAALSGEKRVWS